MATTALTMAFILAAYLIGSISFAVVTSRLAGLPDPRGYGSGNPGATNMLRSGSRMAALLTLLGDAAKGWLAVWLASRLAPQYAVPEWIIPAVALAVFIGHLFPVFHGFKGGKGVATAAGALLAINLQLGLGVLFLWLVIFLIWRISSLAALVAAVFAPLFTVQFFGFRLMALAVLIMSLLLIWRHQSNIRNLLASREDSVDKL
jgi:glycerol-3-phosphate acyltransferase PlsY